MRSDNSFSHHDEARLLEALHREPAGRRVLENGLTLVHRADFSSEVVSVQVWVKTGSIHEGALLGSGLSHYLEHLLFKGTARRSGKSISREVHALGASVNAYTTFDRTVYYIDAPAAAFERVVDILADIVFESQLPEAEVLRERDVILREIDMGLDDPDRRLMQSLFRTAFQKHPYREPVIGHRALFEAVGREELAAYYHGRYRPNNTVVSVVGAVEPLACIETVERRFGGYPRGRITPAPVESEPEQLSARRHLAGGDYKVFRGSLCFKVPHLSHADSPCLDALAQALGGGESSVLWRELRNRRELVSYVDCRNWSPGERGLLWISYVCEPEDAERAESALWEVLGQVAEEGIDEAVVGKARRQALSAEINGRKTMSGQASRLGMAEVVLGDLNYSRRYLARLSEVGPGAVREVARRYLVDAGSTAVGLGPESSVPAIGSFDPARTAPRPFECLRMEGGATLLLQPDSRLPKVHLRAVLLGGPLFEPEGRRGLSALLGELLTKDTEAESADQIAERIESVGGTFSATVGNNTISLALEVLPVDLELARELLENALLRPLFQEERLRTELAAQIAYLQETDDEILDYGLRLLRERFFGTHPMAVGPDGRPEDLERIRREDVQGLYERLVCGENLVLAVCGDFDREAILPGLRALLESPRLRRRFELPAVQDFEPQEAAVMKETVRREQAVVLKAFSDVPVGSEHYVTGEVLNELLSGMSSRLFERVREDRGMAYYVGSTRMVGLRESLFVIYGGTHPDLAGELSKEMDGELARIAAGDVLEDELERVRNRLKAGRVMGRQTIGSRAMHAALQQRYGLPIDDDAEHSAALDGVDASALADFVRAKLRHDRSLELRVGP